MLTKPQYTVQDWLDLHALTPEEVLDYCGQLQGTYTPGIINAQATDATAGLTLDFDQSLEYLVLPSLHELLGGQDLDLSSVKIVCRKTGEIDLPYTEWCDEICAPAIHLVWSGNADDLVCLAHEMAHAAQMILSKNEFMPPVAREVCAFFGELALIRFAKTQSGALYQELCDVWRRENQWYMGSDIVQLVDDLKAGFAPYNYRHNYPLARIAAMLLFARQYESAPAELFLSGSTATKVLDFPEIFEALKQGSQTLFAEQAELQLSLSPEAWIAAQSAQVDYRWFRKMFGAHSISTDKKIGAVNDIRPQAWIKWRSLGVFALAALRKGEADITAAAFIESFEGIAAQQPVRSLFLFAPWVLPLKFDALTALGMAIQQLATSPYHRKFKLSYYLPIEILPPLMAKQVQCYVGLDGKPLGLVTWAWLSKPVQKDLHCSGRALETVEWSEGSSLFCNDWITEAKAFRAAVAHMTESKFPDEIASSLRRYPDGSVRRVNKWVGKNLQKSQIEKRSGKTNNASKLAGG